MLPNPALERTRISVVGVRVTSSVCRRRRAPLNATLCRMTQRLGEKSALEQAAVEQFAEVFTASAGRGVLEFATLLIPPEADARCTLNGTDIFVEVAHIYGTESDTRFLLGRTGYAAPTHEERLQSDLVPLNVRVLSALNAVLAQKARKAYASKPVWLVVRNGFPLWRDTDFKRYRGEIVVPDIHTFSEIWLVCGPRAQFGLMRLDNAA